MKWVKKKGVAKTGRVVALVVHPQTRLLLLLQVSRSGLAPNGLAVDSRLSLTGQDSEA